MKFLHYLLHAAFAICLSGTAVLEAGNVKATIHSTGMTVELRFNTVSGSLYEIKSSTSLAAWTTVESGIPGNNAEVMRSYPTVGVPVRFFQVFATTPVPTGFALIPAGTYTMGNSIAVDDIPDTLPYIPDAPPHVVTVSAFIMARNLITKAEWDDVRGWTLVNDYPDLVAGSGKGGAHPVQMVSWWDCIKYCNARSVMEGLTPVYYADDAQTTVYITGDEDEAIAPTVNWSASGYRLPTEAEWEKAARGGLSGKRFPWGDVISHSQANYFGSSDYSYDLSVVKYYHPDHDAGGFPYTSPAGSFAANGYGLNDMAGNVWQWCWDWYGAYDVGSPVDPRGVASGLYRVIRGGSWGDEASRCRVAFRTAAAPINASDNFGFRVVRRSGP